MFTIVWVDPNQSLLLVQKDAFKSKIFRLKSVFSLVSIATHYRVRWSNTFLKCILLLFSEEMINDTETLSAEAEHGNVSPFVLFFRSFFLKNYKSDSSFVLFSAVITSLLCLSVLCRFDILYCRVYTLPDCCFRLDFSFSDYCSLLLLQAVWLLW